MLYIAIEHGESRRQMALVSGLPRNELESVIESAFNLAPGLKIAGLEDPGTRTVYPLSLLSLQPSAFDSAAVYTLLLVRDDGAASAGNGRASNAASNAANGRAQRQDAEKWAQPRSGRAAGALVGDDSAGFSAGGGDFGDDENEDYLGGDGEYDGEDTQYGYGYGRMRGADDDDDDNDDDDDDDDDDEEDENDDEEDDDDDVKSSDGEYAPNQAGSTMLGYIQQHTAFSDIPMHTVLRVFQRAASLAGGVIDRTSFHACMSEVLSNLPGQDTSLIQLISNRVFDVFDRDSSGTVDFQEFVSGISLLCSASGDDKIQAAFDLFDTDNDSLITFDEMLKYFVSFFTVCFALDNNMSRRFGHISAERLAVATAKHCFARADLNEDGKVTREEFARWVSTKGPSVTAAGL